jgi:FkbM family methyltransferase
MKRLLKNILSRLGYRVQGTRYCPRQLLEPRFLRYLEFDDAVCRRMFDAGKALTFIQVGAFDGVVGDPLRKYIEPCGWRGVMLEPQASVAGRLRELYSRNGNILVLNAALDRSPGKRTLFTIESQHAPPWAGGLASFDRQTIVKHSELVPGLEEMIREETVQCICFEDVLKRLPSEKLDLLQIDTEGADAEILSLFPLDRIRPAIIHWEIKHLSKLQRESCLDRLAAYSYRFASSGGEDMMAVAF